MVQSILQLTSLPGFVPGFAIGVLCMLVAGLVVNLVGLRMDRLEFETRLAPRTIERRRNGRGLSARQSAALAARHEVTYGAANAPEAIATADSGYTAEAKSGTQR